MIEAPTWSYSRWISWLREHNARIRFHSNDTVEVMVNGRRARQRHLTKACRRIYVRLHTPAPARGAR